MSRFSVDESKLPEIGRALARAVTDQSARQDYKNDPNAYLIAAGVDPSAIANIQFEVVEDLESKLKLVIPSKIDESRLNDNDYLRELGISVVLTCHL